MDLLQLLPMEVNYRRVQNIYYRTAGGAYKGAHTRSKAGDRDAAAWIDEFKELGRALRFNLDAILHDEANHG